MPSKYGPSVILCVMFGGPISCLSAWSFHNKGALVPSVVVPPKALVYVYQRNILIYILLVILTSIVITSNY